MKQMGRICTYFAAISQQHAPAMSVNDSHRPTYNVARINVRLVHSKYTELTRTSRSIYTTRLLVTRVSVTTILRIDLPGVKLERLVLGEVATHLYSNAAVRELRFSSRAVDRPSLARVDVLGAQTCLAEDVAAPVEAAVAALGGPPRLTVVAAAAAQLSAAVRGRRAAPAATAPGPRRPGARVRLAVVRRRVQIDEIVLRRTPPPPPLPVVGGVIVSSLLFLLVDRLQRRAVRVESYPPGAVVPPLQPGPDLPEGGQLVPAGARAT